MNDLHSWLPGIPIILIVSSRDNSCIGVIWIVPCVPTRPLLILIPLACIRPGRPLLIDVRSCVSQVLIVLIRTGGAPRRPVIVAELSPVGARDGSGNCSGTYGPAGSSPGVGTGAEVGSSSGVGPGPQIGSGVGSGPDV